MTVGDNTRIAFRNICDLARRVFVKQCRPEEDCEKVLFEEWQSHNPTTPYKSFWAERARLIITQGKRHSTLGLNLCKLPYTQSGSDFLAELQSYGLCEEHTCIDYGCGTLRVGNHVIRYLRPGCYWGMDISECILSEAAKLAGSLLEEKKPNLRVISSGSIEEVANIKPNMLFSLKVMHHVHPSELQEYFENILSIIGASGQAIIAGKWTSGETVQYGAPPSWVHGWPTISELVARSDGQIVILRQKEKRLPWPASCKATTGVFRIVCSRD